MTEDAEIGMSGLEPGSDSCYGRCYPIAMAPVHLLFLPFVHVPK